MLSTTQRGAELSKQWGHGFATGAAEGFADGRALEQEATSYLVANEMRVLFCALITAHKRDDENAFWATVELTKKVLGTYANFDEKDWRVFDGKQSEAKLQSVQPR